MRDLAATVGHYRRLGFELRFAGPDDAPFFAIVGRDGAQIFLKELGEEVPPVPNARRIPGPRGRLLYIDDPDALAREYERTASPSTFRSAIATMGCAGFEIADPDGYILYLDGRLGP